MDIEELLALESEANEEQAEETTTTATKDELEDLLGEPFDDVLGVEEDIKENTTQTTIEDLDNLPKDNMEELFSHDLSEGLITPDKSALNKDFELPGLEDLEKEDDLNFSSIDEDLSGLSLDKELDALEVPTESELAALEQELGLSEPEIEEPAVAEEVISVPEVEPEIEEPTVAEEVISLPEVEPEIEEPVVAEEVISVPEPEPEVEEPVVAEEEISVPEPEPEIEEPAVAEEVISVPEAEPEIEEPTVAEEVISAPEAEPEIEEPAVAEEVISVPEVEPEVIKNTNDKKDIDMETEKSVISETPDQIKIEFGISAHGFILSVDMMKDMISKGYVFEAMLEGKIFPAVMIFDGNITNTIETSDVKIKIHNSKIELIKG